MLRSRISSSVFLALTLGLSGAALADVRIASSPTKHMQCSAGVCVATGKNAVLNTADLTALLANGDATVKTGAGATSILVVDTFSWTSTHRLTLDAKLGIIVQAPVVVAGTGAMTIAYDDGGSRGEFAFAPGGKIDFWDAASSLVIKGNTYRLLPDLPTLMAYVNENPSGLFAFAKDDAEGMKLKGAAIPYFHGVFEGLGHTISSVTLVPKKTKTVPIGLFGTSDGMIRDINLTQINVTGAVTLGGLLGNNTGFLVGDSVSGTVAGLKAGGVVGTSTGTIRRCNSSGTVSGIYAGGIAGVAEGTIDSAYSSMHVAGSGNGPSYEGGLVGQMTSGELSSSHASGAVGDGVIFSVAGGLVGAVISATLKESYAIGDATSVDGPAGGLAGYNGGVIRQSFALENAYARTDAQGGPEIAGGLVGNNGGTVEDSYARGNASTDGGQSGGFFGANNGMASAAYSIGMPSSTLSGQGQLGGFVGADLATLKQVYWNMDTSSIDRPSQGAGNRDHDPGIRGVSDAALKNALPKGFDPQIWGLNAAINDGYPYLLANLPQ